jgi:hypothetical protein
MASSPEDRARAEDAAALIEDRLTALVASPPPARTVPPAQARTWLDDLLVHADTYRDATQRPPHPRAPRPVALVTRARPPRPSRPRHLGSRPADRGRALHQPRRRPPRRRPGRPPPPLPRPHPVQDLQAPDGREPLPELHLLPVPPQPGQPPAPQPPPRIIPGPSRFPTPCSTRSPATSPRPACSPPAAPPSLPPSSPPTTRPPPPAATPRPKHSAPASAR